MARTRGRFERILTLQRLLQQIESVRLAELRAGLHDLRSREAEYISKLENGPSLAATPLVIEGLKLAASRKSGVESMIEAQTAAAREQRRKVLQAERMASDAARDLQRAQAERQLWEIIDWDIGAGKVSAP